MFKKYSRIAKVFFLVATFTMIRMGLGATSNSHDDILAGWYGGIGTDFDFWYNRGNTLEFLTDHGIDWVWLQHQAAVPQILENKAGVTASLKQIKDKTRIWLRLWWWQGKETTFGFETQCSGVNMDKYYPPEGKLIKGRRWEDFADNKEMFDAALKVIDWQIDVILDNCGKDTLYGVTLSEEEPYWQTYGSHTATPVSVLEERGRKITYVVNTMYDHIKSKYPQLKVALGFYPMPLELKDWTPFVVDVSEMQYDAVVMDSYPRIPFCLPQEEWRNELTGIAESWMKWFSKVPKDEFYILLYGLPWNLSSNTSSRSKELAWMKMIFEEFRNFGFRNLGYFMPPGRKTVLRDWILSKIDTRSLGNYEPENIEVRYQKAADKITETKTVGKEIAGYLLPESSSFLHEAEFALSVAKTAKALDENTARTKIVEALERRAEFINASLETAYQKIETARRHLIILSDFSAIFGELVAEECKVLAKDVKPLYRKGYSFSSLPEFFPEMQSFLNETNQAKVRMAQTLKKPFPQIAAVMEKGDYDSALRLSENVGWWLNFNFVNPYNRPLTVPVTIAVSKDKQNWESVYAERPFTAENVKTLVKRPLKERPKFARINLGTFQGSVFIDEILLRNGGTNFSPDEIEKHGTVNIGENFVEAAETTGEYKIEIVNTKSNEGSGIIIAF